MGFWDLQKKPGKIIAGTDVCIDNIKKRKAKLVIIAKDASEKTKQNIKYICEQNDTICLELGKIEDLSKAIGNSNKAIIGILEKNFAQEIQKIISGGEDLWGK